MSKLNRFARCAVLVLASALAFSALAAKRDFDGDGKGDLLWMNFRGVPSDAIWLMNGTVPVSGALFSVPRVNWHSYWTADLNGDGTDDIIMGDGGTYPSPPETYIRLMNGVTPIATATLKRGHVVAVGDFDADGRADLVWRDGQSGATTLVLMDGVVENTVVPLLAGPNWEVLFAGDFNGDGKSDLVWNNVTTREKAVWLMDGSRYLAGAIVLADPCWWPGSGGTGDVYWSLGNSGDLDGDGKDDIVWGNVCTGETAIWLMDGTSMKAGTIAVSDPNWIPAAFADLNGDGRRDIVWGNVKTNAAHVWLMNGVWMTAGGPIPLGGAWVIAADDLDGDGRDDLVTQLYDQLSPGTSIYAAWLMDGMTIRSMAPLLSSDFWTIWP